MTARIHPHPAPPRTRRRPPSLKPTTIQTILPQAQKPVALTWSPSGTHLAVATQHGPVLLYYILSNKSQVLHPHPVRTFRAHTADVLHLSFSSAAFLLSASMDRSVRLWHPDAPVCLRHFAHPDMVTAVAFHPHDHNHVLTAGCDGAARLWRLDDHVCVAVAHLAAVITAVQFDASGTRAYVGTYDGRVHVLRVDPQLGTTQPPHALDNSSLRVERVVHLGRRPRRKASTPRKTNGTRVGGMCIRQSRLQTVVVGSDARVHVFGKDGQVAHRLRPSGSRKEGSVALGASLSADDRFVLHDAVGGAVRVIDLTASLMSSHRGDALRRKDKELPAKLESVTVAHDTSVSCAAFASASVLQKARPGKDATKTCLMAVGCDDGSIRIVENECSR